jgi:hypothetical protein
LIRAYGENTDERVLSMCAWSLGRVGGGQARQALESYRGGSPGQVAEEVERALEMLG